MNFILFYKTVVAKCDQDDTAYQRALINLEIKEPFVETSLLHSAKIVVESKPVQLTKRIQK